MGAEHDRFLELIESSAADREALLQRFESEDPGCSERLRRLLSAHRRADAQTPQAALGLPETSLPGPLAPGDRVADFTIVRMIATGGMGVVYEAEQKSPARRVALKLVRADLTSAALLERFAFEADLLGRLQHPAVAQVFASGSRSEQGVETPYLAMELVEGRPLDEYARGLEPARIVELVADVADGVAHAHRRGVIHRDLKPSNILVTEDGQPKILDFGVGRLVHREAVSRATDDGQLLGTLVYMSPEQLRGQAAEIDTRCDVWALGVIAYELLAGRHPLAIEAASVAEVVERVEGADAPRLSAVDRRLAGDVEAIVGKAIEKDPGRRYSTAAELAADLRRHLENQPVAARPPGAMYLLSRFTRRHRVLVASVVVVFVAVVTALVITTSALRRSRRAESEARNAHGLAGAEAKRARLEADRFRGVSAVFRDLMLSADSATGEQDAEDVFFDALERLRRAEAAGDEAGLMSLEEAVGLAAARIGFLDVADEHLERARGLAIDGGEAAAPELARVLSAISHLRFEQGRQEEARAAGTEALEILDRIGSGDTAARRHAASSLSVALEYLGRFEEAEAVILDLRDRERARGVPVAKLQERLATLATRRGDLARAESLLREVLEAVTAPLERADTLARLGHVAGELGRFREGTDHLREAVKLKEEHLGAGHPGLAHTRHNLAVKLSETGELDLGREQFERALAVYRRVYPARHLRTANTLRGLGKLEKNAGNAARARELLAEAVAIFDELEAGTPERASALTEYAAVLGEDEAARRVELVEEALAIQRALFGEIHGDVARSLNQLGLFAHARGDLEGAERFMRAAQDVNEKLDPRGANTGIGLTNLGALLAAREKFADAVEAQDRALAILESCFDERHPRVADALHHKSRCLMKLGERREALAALERCAAIRAEALPRHAVRVVTLYHLGIVLAELEESERAEEVLERALDLAERHGHGELVRVIEKFISGNFD